MAEEELRRETERLFQDMGLTDLPSDTLDFFQRNLENGTSPDWKSGLKAPTSTGGSRVPRRTNSEGTVLVHLKKKYSTGLNPDYHSKRTAAIAAVTQPKPATTADSNSDSSNKTRSRKVSPAAVTENRFGYSKPSSSAPSPTAESSKPSEVGGTRKDNNTNTASTSPATARKASEQSSMLKKRTPKSSIPTPSSVGNSQPDGVATPPRRLMHTSSAGSIRPQAPGIPVPIAKTSSSGVALGKPPINHDPSTSYYHRRTGSGGGMGKSEPMTNGVQPSSSSSALQGQVGAAPRSNSSGVSGHSHSPAVSTTANTSTPPVHNSIDSLKLASVNMRSLTKSIEKKSLHERKNSDTGIPKSADRRMSHERKASDSEKPSFIPTPQTAGVSSNGGRSKIPITRSSTDGGAANNSSTQVVYNRKSSFKVINVSSSSHRIMHTSQDGGTPKRLNSINRGSRPISVVPGVSTSAPPSAPSTTPSQQQQQQNPAPPQQGGEGREVPPATKQGHVRPAPPPPSSSSAPSKSANANDSSSSSGYDSLEKHLVEGAVIKDASNEQGKKKRRDGVYDRLSPPAPVEAGKKEDPVYETINTSHGHRRSNSTDNKMRKNSPPTSDVHVRDVDITKSLNLTSRRDTNLTSPTEDLSVTRSLKLAGSGSSRISAPRAARQSPGPTEEQSGDRDRDRDGERRSKLASPPRSISVDHGKNSGFFPADFKRKTSLQVQGKGEDALSTKRPEESTKPNTKPSTAPHKPLSASLSDTTPRLSLPAKNSELSSESDADLSHRSSTSNSLYSPEPASSSLERQKKERARNLELLAPEERQAKLELNWSNQSLDRSMNDVVTSTVAALSTLVEVLATPSAATADKTFEFDSVDGETTDKKWYQNSDDEDDAAVPSHSSSSITSPTGLTSSQWPAPTHTPERRRSPEKKDHTHQERQSHSSTRDPNPHFRTKNPSSHSGTKDPSPRSSVKDLHPRSNTNNPNLHSNTKDTKPRSSTSDPTSHVIPRPLAPATNHAYSSTHRRRSSEDSQTDGSVISRRPSDGNVPKKPKPVVAPKTQRQRSKSAGVITRRPRTNEAPSYSKRSLCVSNSVPGNPSDDGRYPTKNETSLTSLESYSSGVSQVSKSSSVSKASSSSQASKGVPLSHDYAVLEPTDHDYAILDPEYHEEFYGYCASCKEPVIGMASGCTAIDKVFHNKCFKCSKCGVSLIDVNFYTEDDKLVCEKDHKVIVEYCHHCKRSIQDRVLKALGHSFHPPCFRCVVCGVCLDGVHYTSDKKGRVYCVQDYHKTFGPKCDICQHPIIPRNGQKRSLRVIAMEKNYHIHCYKCEDCEKQLANRTGGGEKCYPLSGHLLCRACHSKRVLRTSVDQRHQLVT